MNEIRKIKISGRHIITGISALLLVLLYLLIFFFSGQNGEESGGLSHMVSEKCVEIINAFSGEQWTDIFREELILYFEHPIRKLAHFSEYACMGILVYFMLRPWKDRGRKLYGTVVLWVFLSAAADEFHQLFVPGRYGSFTDVCLDTCGGVFGMVICILIEKVRNGRKRKKRGTGRKQCAGNPSRNNDHKEQIT